MLKITPAHDQLDFEIGQRHDLQFVDLFNPDGSLNEFAGADFEGMDRFDARKAAIEKLKAQGDLIDEETHENNVGFLKGRMFPLNRDCPSSGFSSTPEWKKPSRRSEMDISNFSQNDGKKLTNARKYSWTGASVDNFGGDIEYRFGIVKESQDPTRKLVCGNQSPDDIENWEQDEDVLDTWRLHHGFGL